MQNNLTPFQAATGRCGDITYYSRKGYLVARVRRNDQMHCSSFERNANSVTMSNSVRLWKTFPRTWMPSFSKENDRTTDYNQFIAHARYGWQVYLGKYDSIRYITLLTPVAVSGGLLPPVKMEETDNSMLTNIILNDFILDDDTTVSAMAEAVLERNPLYRAGDALLLYNARQRMTTERPWVSISATFLPLDPCDSRRLSALLAHGVVLMNADGRLATPFGDGMGVAWVHLRPVSKGTGWLRSTQWMEVRNTLAERYMTDEARDRAVKSYEKLRGAKKNDNENHNENENQNQNN